MMGTEINKIIKNPIPMNNLINPQISRNANQKINISKGLGGNTFNITSGKLLII